MLIDVVNVGDGACTVIRYRGETMVMDCGSWHAKDGREPAALLRATLGATASIPSTVVVTHFDLDHWMGLKAFADASTAGSERVQLIHPRFPNQAKPLQAALLAYQTLKLTAPERSALDLFRAWESKSAEIVRRSACAGDKFTAVGTDWHVFWPPRAIGSGVSKKFNRVAKESENLAQEYEPLRRALDWAFESRFLADDPEETNESNDEWAPDSQEDTPEETNESNDEWAPDSQEDTPEETNESNDEWAPDSQEDAPVVQEVDPLDSYGAGDFADAPHDLRERLQKNRRDVQRLNNELSLVVGEDDCRLLSFGDVQGWGLNELLRRGELEGCYETILAPHHGTQIPGRRSIADFPLSIQIIAQNGSGHRPRLKNELSSRTNDLISTADVGSFSWHGYWAFNGNCLF